VDSTTTYVLRVTVTAVTIAESVQAASYQPLENAAIPTPTLGETLYYSDDLNSLAVKDSNGNVRPLAEIGSGGLAAAGSLYFSTAIETAIAAKETWYKALGTTTLDHQDNVDADSVSNRLRYTGATTAHFDCHATFSATSAGNGKVYRFGLSKNGTIVASSPVSRKIASGADVGAMACHAVIELAQNDYVELVLANWTDTTNATVELGSMSIHVIG
jgi:hypothetical protein